jgi:phosphoribosylformylglycinamidine cyclo-ligase
MAKKKQIGYRDAGVNIDEADRAVASIRKMARATFNGSVLTDIGSFGGGYLLKGYRDPVLVSSADGVGTKLKLAFITGRHHTIGEDLVNHCVNDILVQGARPRFFLDYLATGRLLPDVAEQVIGGVARGCRENGCALVGGETAEMPGFYADGEYDIAGFIVGVVDKSKLIDGRLIEPGDAVFALPSSGLHTNGYSLARRVLLEDAGLQLDQYVPELGRLLGDELLQVHRSYLNVVTPILETGWIKGLAHITGGGITENLPRILPTGCAAEVHIDTRTTPIFELIQKLGNISRDEMFRAFNMGVGMIIVCSQRDADSVLRAVVENGCAVWQIGRVVRGERTVRYVEQY